MPTWSDVSVVVNTPTLSTVVGVLLVPLRPRVLPTKVMPPRSVAWKRLTYQSYSLIVPTPVPSEMLTAAGVTADSLTLKVSWSSKLGSRISSPMMGTVMMPWHLSGRDDEIARDR